jgi:hypothetical protein
MPHTRERGCPERSLCARVAAEVQHDGNVLGADHVHPHDRPTYK